MPGDLLDEYARTAFDPLQLEIGVTHAVDSAGIVYGFIRINGGYGHSKSVTLYPESIKDVIRMLEAVQSVLEKP